MTKEEFDKALDELKEIKKKLHPVLPERKEPTMTIDKIVNRIEHLQATQTRMDEMHKLEPKQDYLYRWHECNGAIQELKYLLRDMNTESTDATPCTSKTIQSELFDILFKRWRYVQDKRRSVTQTLSALKKGDRAGYRMYMDELLLWRGQATALEQAISVLCPGRTITVYNADIWTKETNAEGFEYKLDSQKDNK